MIQATLPAAPSARAETQPNTDQTKNGRQPGEGAGAASEPGNPAPYAPALAILDACDHEAPNGAELNDGRKVCLACWNSYVHARRAIRKGHLAADARQHPCERCGEKRATWTLARFKLCGWCKTRTMGEVHQTIAGAGPGLAVIAGMSFSSDMVDVAGWKALR